MKKNIVSLLLILISFSSCCTYAAQKCNPSAYKNTVIKYAQKKNYQKIIDLTNVCIAQYPNSASLYNNRGNAYTKLKKYDLALKDLNKAIEIDKSKYSIYVNRGNLYIATAKPKEAISDYSEAIKLKPDYAPLYSRRCLAKVLIKDFDGAKKDNAQAQKLGLNQKSVDFNNQIIEKAKSISKNTSKK